MGMANRFKGLDLIERVLEELWMGRYVTLYKRCDQNHPKEKCKKAKWLSEEDMQIAEERREVKNERERQRYTQLNAEFQRIARRGEKTLSEQCFLRPT